MKTGCEYPAPRATGFLVKIPCISMEVVDFPFNRLFLFVARKIVCSPASAGSMVI
jgi:hypothetical protein